VLVVKRFIWRSQVTKVFVELGIPSHAVVVIVHEIPKSHWGIDGITASEKILDNS
jgi:phenylpyruvate tautomerase PptA (4-oxalocrotonate tautomerase family)